MSITYGGVNPNLSTVNTGEWKLLADVSVGTGATLDFELGFVAGWDHKFSINRVYPSIADLINIRVKEAGAYISGATDYRFQLLRGNTAAADSSSAQFSSMLFGNTTAATSGEAESGEITFLNPANAATQTEGFGNSIGSDAVTASARTIMLFSTEREAAAACQGVRFFWNLGNNFAGGRIQQYTRKSTL